MFEPRTFGYEWETWVLKQNMMPVDKKDVAWLAYTLRERLPWSRTGMDWSRLFNYNLLELRSGIMRSWEELQSRTKASLEEVLKLCEEKNWVFLPSGCHPAFGGAAGLHIHIGSVHEYELATRFANDMARYAPVFAALMANSPVWGNEFGEFKTYRVLKYAEWCSVPRRIVDPRMAQWSWGDDVCVKIGMKPTVEIRIADCPFSPRLLNEYVALGVGLFLGLSESRNPRELSHRDYIDSLVNRWRAAKYGLQAEFVRDGGLEDVSQLVKELLRIAEPGLEQIGTGPEELGLIRVMAESHQTQADFQSLVHRRNRDPHRFSRELANILGRGDPFREYLEIAPPLRPVEPMEVEDYILSKIGIETPYSCLQELLGLPHAALEERLEKLEADGKITVERTPEKGALYSSLPPQRRRISS